MIRKPKQRLGHNDINEIKDHEWLIDINWNKLLEHKITSPFTPKNEDNFDKKFCEGVEKLGEETLTRYKFYMQNEDYSSLFENYTIINYIPSKEVLKEVGNSNILLSESSNLSTQMSKKCLQKNINLSKDKNEILKDNVINKINGQFEKCKINNEYSKNSKKLKDFYSNFRGGNRNNEFFNNLKGINVSNEWLLKPIKNKSTSVKLLPKKTKTINKDDKLFEPHSNQNKINQDTTININLNHNSGKKDKTKRKILHLNSNTEEKSQNYLSLFGKGSKLKLLENKFNNKNHLTLNIDDKSNKVKNLPIIESLRSQKSFKDIFNRSSKMSLVTSTKLENHRRNYSLGQTNYFPGTMKNKNKLMLKTSS